MGIVSYFKTAGAMAVMTVALWGCGSANNDAPGLNQAGSHPGNWLVAHRAEFLANPGVASQCNSCHGSDLSGGIAHVGCFSSALNAFSCHGHGSFTAPAWSDPSRHGAFAKRKPDIAKAFVDGFANCRTCHGGNFAGGQFARTGCFATTLTINGVQVGCHSTAPHPPAPWRDSVGSPGTHTTTDPDNAPLCGECHLNNLRLTTPQPVPAGVTPDCFSGNLCHGDINVPHPALNKNGVDFTLPSLHGPAAKVDLTFCQRCHSDKPTGAEGSNPRFNLPVGRLSAGCESPSCHKPFYAHPPVPGATGPAQHWYAHGDAGALQKACTPCHGAALEGSPAIASPPCTSCHTALAAGAVPTLGLCVSCHGTPPNGTAAPNRAGAHLKHNALPRVSRVCNTCHNGAGTGSGENHFYNNQVDLGFLPAYNAKTGSAAFSATERNCTNVSCHGGQTTPEWQTGAIDVNTQCTLCHQLGIEAQSPQFNSYFSGRHDFLIRVIGLICTDCHDVGRLASATAPSHFSNLDTPEFELDPVNTLRTADLRFVDGNPPSCTPQAPGEILPRGRFSLPSGCHIGTKFWQ